MKLSNIILVIILLLLIISFHLHYIDSRNIETLFQKTEELKNQNQRI